VFGTASVDLLQGLLAIRRMLGELYRLRSRGAFAGSPRGVLVYSSQGVFAITSLDSGTYRRSLSPLADSYAGALAAASLFNW